MIKTVIIDDEPAAIEIVSGLCQRQSEKFEVCGTATTLKEGISLVKKHQPDLVFLDVELPEGLGFEVVRALSDFNFHVVFVTAFEGYALEAIKHHALDYILKPIDPVEFDEMLTFVSQKIEKKETMSPNKLTDLLNPPGLKKIAIPDSFGMIYVEHHQIVRVEADGTYSIVYLLNGKKYIVSRILKNFEKALSNFGFSRVHRAHLVNMAHVQSFNRTEGGFLIMANGDKVPVSRKEKENVHKRLTMGTLEI